MTKNDYDLIREARSYTDGLINLLANMGDDTMDFIKPYEMQLLLQPISDRLGEVMGETDAA